MMGQREMLRKAMQFILSNPEMRKIPAMDWAKTLWHAHKKGMLFLKMNKEHSEVKLILCAYRVPKWEEKYTEQMPEEDSGNIAYCPFAISDGSDKFMLLRAVKGYLKMNPEVEEVLFYSHITEDKLKRFKRPAQRPEMILN